MKYGLCLLLLSSLSSCHQAENPQQSPVVQADPLLGHWQCDSVASINLDSTGRPLEAAQLEGASFALDVTPTRIALSMPSILPGDTAFSTYTRHGQKSTMTFTQLNGEAQDLNVKEEPNRIITLTPTILRLEKTYSSAGKPRRTRYFYHR